ncbi:Rv3235 family protein [Actinomyces sp. B33]|uniref:Rv3235 family protein n=1 Tax=Actinomyces sp. B33 TaxID=2942131 RepID=UPI002341CAD0|nr:Rv3235 family protein [Actinomyces sp. B33]MDC4232679.1 Rv3235 family protein [Actinomyces sp. B33]
MTALLAPAVPRHAPRSGHHRPPARERRCLRWDLDTDASIKTVSKTRTWLASAAPQSVVPTLPEPGPWAAAMARAIVEAVLGMRPTSQLQRWLVPPLLTVVSRLRVPRDPAAPRRSCRPTAWRSCEIRPGVVEAAVVVSAPDGPHVVALRMEKSRGRWITTALELT